MNFILLLKLNHGPTNEVKTLIKTNRLEQLQLWRQKMRTSIKEAGKWTKKDNRLPVTSVHEPTFKAGQASRSNQESLETILHFWGRDRPAVDDAFLYWQQGIPASPALPCADLTADELHNQALRQKGSAAGPDGLDGNEVAQLPIKAWDILAS